MNPIHKRIISTLLALLSSAAMAGDTIYKEQLIDGLAIKDVVSHNAGVEEDKIIVQEYKSGKPEINGIIPKPTINYSEPLLTITSKNLPVTEDMCLHIDSPTCSELKSYGSHAICYNPCIGGLESLIYDKNKKILYLSAAPTFLGTAGGTYFIFTVDLKTKKIEFFSEGPNPFNPELSPSGKYLLTYFFNGISIFDINAKKRIHIIEENTTIHGVERIHYVGHIKWLSDTRISYRDGVKHDKFQDGNDEVTEYTYDIPSQKVIQSRKVS